MDGLARDISERGFEGFPFDPAQPLLKDPTLAIEQEHMGLNPIAELTLERVGARVVDI